MFLNGKLIKEGDLPIHLTLAEEKEYASQAQQGRSRSQAEDKTIFWISLLNESMNREVQEVFRSEEILSAKERTAQTRAETSLVGEEKRRLKRHSDELKRLLKAACLSGAVYFRGNDRGPGESATDVARAASDLLGLALPEVFDRFKEA